MGYVGNQITNSYSSLAKQTITGDGGTSYTLDHAVANAQEVEIFVNNVRQEPGVAYTVSDTALTMTGNVSSTDDFYVVFQGKALQTVTPPDLSVTTAKIVDANVTAAKLASDSVTTAKIADDAVTTAKLPDDAVTLAKANDDFYKTGTFTPTLDALTTSPSSVTYSHRDGYYTKIGNVVHCFVYIETSARSGGVGAVEVTGLPYTVKNDQGSGLGPVALHEVNTSGAYVVAQPIANNTKFRLLEIRDNLSWANVDISNYDSGPTGVIWTQLTYLTDD